MREDALMQLIGDQFAAAFAAQGLEVTVEQAFQPTSQGRSTTATLYYAIVGVARPMGWPKRTVAADPDDPLGMIRTETQKYATDVQATGSNRRGPSSSELSAGDIATTARDLLQSETMMDALRLAGVEIFQPGPVRQLHFVNEAEQFDTIPSFDFVLTHEQITLSKIPAAASTEYRQYPV